MSVSTKIKMRLGMVLALAVAVWLLVTYRYVGPMVPKQPWMIYNAGMERCVPFADKTNPDLLYLAFMSDKGDAVKIDLRRKTVEPHCFNVKLEELDRLVNQYDLGFSFTPTHEAPRLGVEFLGRTFVHKAVGGSGLPSESFQVGTVQARFGLYRVLDDRGGAKVELLRARVWNSELDWGGLGTAYLSPDRKWAVFQVDASVRNVYIFNRESHGPEQQQ